MLAFLRGWFAGTRSGVGGVGGLGGRGDLGLDNGGLLDRGPECRVGRLCHLGDGLDRDVGSRDVRSIVGNWHSLPVRFSDVEGIVDELVVLMLRERVDAIIALHDKLYGGVLKTHLRDDISYQPHVTLGRVAGNPSHADFPAMQQIAAREVRGEWRCVLRELAIITLQPDGKISIDKTIPLNFA